MRSGSAGAQEEAAAALQRLACNAENKVSIASSGGIAPLVELVRSGSAVAQEQAAGALRNLALNAEIRDSIVSAGDSDIL